MARHHKLTTSPLPAAPLVVVLDASGTGSVRLAHLGGMDATTPTSTPHSSPVASDDRATDGAGRADLAGQPAVLTISQLAAYLGVSLQCLYDLRSAGRGPRGFRVGRELRFRRTEVEAWLAGLEQADAVRHRAKPTAADPDRLAGQAW